MGDEIPKCRWCNVSLLSNGMCPNKNHPTCCPICGAQLEHMFCSNSECFSNTMKPTVRHSSFPPLRRAIDHGSEHPIHEQPVRIARVLGVIMPIDHPDACDVEDRDTSPDVRTLFPSTPSSEPYHESSFPGCDDPPTVRARPQSGVFLNSRCTEALKADEPPAYKRAK